MKTIKIKYFTVKIPEDSFPNREGAAGLCKSG